VKTRSKGGCRKNWISLGLVALALVTGCGAERANPRLILRYEKGLDVRDQNSVVQQAGPGPVVVIDLGRTAWVSEHLAVVREVETPHYHRFHDITVFVLRGEGVMDVEGKRFTVRAGDVVHVHRGVRHFFRNTGNDAAVTFVTFSPPFDGRDTVTAEAPAAEQPAAPATSGTAEEGKTPSAAQGGASSVGGAAGGGDRDQRERSVTQPFAR
jgi:mannose-6-phosphate isomerase-like protein (cupin superfamily)